MERVTDRCPLCGKPGVPKSRPGSTGPFRFAKHFAPTTRKLCSATGRSYLGAKGEIEDVPTILRAVAATLCATDGRRHAHALRELAAGIERYNERVDAAERERA